MRPVSHSDDDDDPHNGIGFFRGLVVAAMAYVIIAALGTIAYRLGWLWYVLFAISCLVIILLGHGVAKGIIRWRLNNRNKDQDK